MVGNLQIWVQARRSLCISLPLGKRGRAGMLQTNLDELVVGQMVISHSQRGRLTHPIVVVVRFIVMVAVAVVPTAAVSMFAITVTLVLFFLEPVLVAAIGSDFSWLSSKNALAP